MSIQIAASMIDGTFNPNNLGYDIDVTYDIVDNPGPNWNNIPNFGWLYQDGWSWGRERHFRERKAEVNFRNGGMTAPSIN